MTREIAAATETAEALEGRSKSSGFSLTSPPPLYTVCVAWGDNVRPIRSQLIPYLMPAEETIAFFKTIVSSKDEGKITIRPVRRERTGRHKPFA